MKLKQEIDLTTAMTNALAEHEAKILRAVVKHLNIKNYDVKELTAEYEDVKNFSRRIFTVRYKGELMYRRFPADIYGFLFRYEAPIFNNLS